MARLRQQSLRLLDDFVVGADVGPLMRTTAALKLRVSMMAQTTAAALRSRGLAAEAGGLGYIKSQPTADDKILRSRRAFGLSVASLTLRLSA